MHQLFNAYLAQVRQHGTASGMMRVVTKSGEKQVLMYGNTLCEDIGQAPFVLGYAQDIAALREREERFRNQLDGSIQGLFSHIGGISQFANLAMARIFACDNLDELIGQDHRVIWARQEHD